MIRTKVYSSVEADFSLKYIENRIGGIRILMAKPDFFLQTKIEKDGDDEKYIKSNIFAIKEQWEELNDIYHWLGDKGYLDEVCEIESLEGFDSLALVADKVFSWQTSKDVCHYLLGNADTDLEKKQMESVHAFFESRNDVEIEYDGGDRFSGNLDLIPHLEKRFFFAGVRADQEIPCLKHVTHIFKAPIITLELVDNRFKHLSDCFLQIDEKNAMYFSKAFSEESIEFLHQIYDHIIDLPEEEVLNFSLMVDLFSGKDGKIALMQTRGNSLTSKILKKFGYKIIDINLSEFNKFGYGIKHLRNVYASC